MEVEHYAIDADISSFTVRAFASGMLSALRHSPTLVVNKFTGKAQFSPGTFESASIRIKVSAGSLTVVGRMSDKDRIEVERTMNCDMLETEKYPEIVFESSKVSASKAGNGQYWINLIGDLSLHGVVRSQPVAAQVMLSGEDLRVHGEVTLLQTAYKIRPVSLAGGTLKVKDQLKCSFDIVARKQPPLTQEHQGRVLAVEGS